MRKTLISLDEQDRDWLEHYSQSNNQSLAKTIRDAVKALREQQRDGQHINIFSLTAGIWRDKVLDGLKFQSKLRAEWQAPNPRKRSRGARK